MEICYLLGHSAIPARSYGLTCRCETELLNTYPQIRELFDRYQSAQIELISINNRQEFVNGFRIGGQMPMETLGKIE